MIAIIDYGLGNLASISNALNRLELPSRISNSTKIITKSQVLLLPGVGSAKEGMKKLKESGLETLLFNEIKKGKPLLGICMGMQLLFERSEEGNAECMGILKGTVKKFQKERKIPQIGWNKVKVKSLFRNLTQNNYFYFINSYYCQPEDKSIIAGETVYGENFCSMAIKENIVTTQFHPEKSGKAGQILLKNIFAYFKILSRGYKTK